MVFCDVAFRKAVTLVLFHGHFVDEGGSFGNAVEMNRMILTYRQCCKSCKFAMELHLQGFLSTIFRKSCGRYHGTHPKSLAALVKPHSNLQLVREYSLWKRRFSDSFGNLQPLFSGDRFCMLSGHFPVPELGWFRRIEFVSIIDEFQTWRIRTDVSGDMTG